MTQMVPFQQKVLTARAFLEKLKPQLSLALPKHLNADRLLRVALTSMTREPKLLDCTQESLAAAMIQSAQLGLEPDGVLGNAYLIAYGTTCRLIPGYRGLMQLARQSGAVVTIEARVVHTGDKFKYKYGLAPVLEHEPADEDDDAAKPTVPPPRFKAAYAIGILKEGHIPQWDVMRKAAIERIRKRSPNGNAGAWITDYEEMAKKTVVRRLCKMLPSSVELQRAVALDERAELGLPLDLDIPLDLSEPKPSKLDALAGQMRDQAAREGGAEPAA